MPSLPGLLAFHPSQQRLIHALTSTSYLLSINKGLRCTKAVCLASAVSDARSGPNASAAGAASCGSMRFWSRTLCFALLQQFVASPYRGFQPTIARGEDGPGFSRHAPMDARSSPTLLRVRAPRGPAYLNAYQPRKHLHQAFVAAYTLGTALSACLAIICRHFIASV